MKRWIAFPRSEGESSRQAHAALPENTYERELGKEGFFGPATHMYHRRPPTGWESFEGPIRPRAFDAGKLSGFGPGPLDARELMGNASVSIRFWRCDANMDHLVRNSDGDELLFVHAGCGQLFCDYGHLSVGEGDYVILPRGPMWRLEIEQPMSLLMV